jgi:hypothetical protein
MNPADTSSNSPAVLGQKYAFATASLLLGLASFVSLLGLEKALLAILFGYLALKHQPGPVLAPRRNWARAGVALGVAMLVFVPTLLIAFQDRVAILIDALQRLPH